MEEEAPFSGPAALTCTSADSHASYQPSSAQWLLLLANLQSRLCVPQSRDGISRPLPKTALVALI